MSDKVAWVRKSAFESLGSFNLEPSPLVPLLRQGFSDPDPAVRDSAYWGWSELYEREKLDDEVVVPPVIAALADPAVQIRLRAVISLGRIVNLRIEGRPPDRERFPHPPQPSFEESMTKVVPALNRALSDPDPSVRIQAAHVLKEIAGYTRRRN